MVCSVQSSDLTKCTRHQSRTHHGLFADGKDDVDRGDQHLQLVHVEEVQQAGATSLVCCGVGAACTARSFRQEGRSGTA